MVKFKENVPIETLQQLKEVVGIEQAEEYNYKINTTNPESVRKQLMELSLKNNLNIVSLQSESNSLEEVFRSLTSTNHS